MPSVERKDRTPPVSNQLLTSCEFMLLPQVVLGGEKRTDDTQPGCGYSQVWGFFYFYFFLWSPAVWQTRHTVMSPRLSLISTVDLLLNEAHPTACSGIVALAFSVIGICIKGGGKKLPQSQPEVFLWMFHVVEHYTQLYQGSGPGIMCKSMLKVLTWLCI